MIGRTAPPVTLLAGPLVPLRPDIHVSIMPTSSTLSASTAVPCPVVESLDAILPEEPLLMMGAGPVPIPAAVAKANTIVINHLGGTMVKVIGQVKTMARYVFQTNSKWVLGVAGPGSAAMEMAISNLAWTGTRVLSIKNGFFSDRMAEMGRRVGAQVSTLNVEDRSVASLEQ
ncbi:MAG: alanine-glyoxylate transaminase / serine-glyoxylate transaminase / serine-pyruvate transaminase, partial [Paraburkholderia sp.]|nr:alanine-glyoxylate transaminase / serine-glyoxylate transaminase / serine-pyruvate transaminase [Paraburkholderia sp.]